MSVKPQRLWAVTYINSRIIAPDSIRRTRREAISAYCDGEPVSWAWFAKRGAKAVRVTVTVEDRP